MIVSYNWLKTLINTQKTAEELDDLLTNTGLEVEKIHKKEGIKGGLNGLVVGHVLTCEKAPDSDKLSLTTVNIGFETVSIVCGAPNVVAGQKVVVAPVGCTIHPVSGEAFTLKKAKIRGHVSEGMICAEDEIGLGKNHDGIMVLPENLIPGTPLSEVFNLKNDYQIEIGLTPNRGDAASHLGVARDIRAITGESINMPTVADVLNTSPSPIEVSLPDPTICPRYSGILLKNITIKESPEWLKERLQSIDLKSINNVVDTTNYVLHELGQPIHAFDAENISGNKIVVRMANKGEKILTLDDVERALTGDEMVIADGSKPVAIAGVFGGKHSGVTQSTTSVFIESAYFNPGTVRKSAKTQGLSTDASFRYERGCDPNITVFALKRVVHILQEVAGAEIASGVVDVYPKPIQNQQIEVSCDWLNGFCGTSISSKEISGTLAKLDIETIGEKDGVLTLSIPPYRSDVLRPVDIAEEFLRIYGYNQVEIPKRLSMTPSIMPSFDKLKQLNKVANYLVSKGFYETMSNSQTKKSDRLTENAVHLLNPLSIENSVMRTDMVDGILQSVAYNINRKSADITFFEFGKIYSKTEAGYAENNRLMLVCTGKSTSKNWNTPAENADYFYLKGILEGLTSLLNISTKRMFKLLTISSFDKKTLKEFGIKQAVYYADIDWDALLKMLQNVKFTLNDVPVFPIVSRDLSLVLDKTVKYGEVERICRETAGHFAKEVEIFDVYEGKNIEDGKKSYAISIDLYDAKQTMTDEKIDGIMNKLMRKLEEETGAFIRK